MSIEKLQDWQREYKKGYSKPFALFALAEVKRSYAYLLTKKIFELSHGEITITGSNIYPMLSKLESERLIVSQFDENNRKYYTLTESGEKFLAQLKDSIKGFHKIVLEVTESSNQGDEDNE